jgi:hypothetical protein
MNDTRKAKENLISDHEAHLSLVPTAHDNLVMAISSNGNEWIEDSGLDLLLTQEGIATLISALKDMQQ